VGRALVVRSPGEIDLEPRAAPEPGPGEVLVRPLVAGLCGTDLEIVDGRIDPAYVRYPVVLGHEWSGAVAEDRTGAFLPGIPVVAEGIVPCGHCQRCLAGDTNLCLTYDELGFTRDGAAADVIAVPAGLVHPLAPAVDIEDAALVEPSAVVYRALSRVTPAAGARALVIGDGTVALLAAHLLGLFSPAEVVMLGRRPEQAELAVGVGSARFTTDPREAGGDFDLVVEAAGATQAALTALDGARRGGTVVLLGLPPHGETAAVAIDDVVTDDLTVLGSFSYTSDAWTEVVALLNEGRIQPGRVVTHRFPLDAWTDALATLRGADGPRGKVLLRIGEA
jgi:L-iditol 2-dehydrogenase